MTNHTRSVYAHGQDCYFNDDLQDDVEKLHCENNSESSFLDFPSYSVAPCFEDGGTYGYKTSFDVPASYLSKNDVRKEEPGFNEYSILGIESQDKELQLQQCLFHQDGPWNHEWVVYVARTPLPGESSFSAETLEPAIAPRRRAYTSQRRAEVAYVRSNGGACAECRRNKQACPHRLEELEQLSHDGSTTAVETSSERIVPESARRVSDRRGPGQTAYTSPFPASETTLNSFIPRTWEPITQLGSFQSERHSDRDTSINSLDSVRPRVFPSSFMNQASGLDSVLAGISGGVESSRTPSIEWSVNGEVSPATQSRHRIQPQRWPSNEPHSNNLLMPPYRPDTLFQQNLSEGNESKDSHVFSRKAGPIYNEQLPLAFNGDTSATPTPITRNRSTENDRLFSSYTINGLQHHHDIRTETVRSPHTHLNTASRNADVEGRQQAARFCSSSLNSNRRPISMSLALDPLGNAPELATRRLRSEEQPTSLSNGVNDDTSNMSGNMQFVDQDYFSDFDINDFISWPEDESSAGHVHPNTVSLLPNDAAFQLDLSFGSIGSNGL
ncbi:hypothetical protein MMC13_002018 [Lambiella insularis]|nr:hypothetical protein [Lambiella insularis]